ncbi:MAG TPA: GPP34 family phosphoprotein [Streptosporangiaceae bacterium]|nr:GPP34 family phosphoprotein [Streptosporangiaceae bacterium]
MTYKASSGQPVPVPPVHARVGLAGTGRLADDVWLLAHHEVSGRPLLQPRAIGLGLAGALLAELALIGAVRVAADGCAVTGRVRPQDGLARAVQLRMLGERDRHGARDWLAFLAQSAEGDVARRLASSGYLILAESRRPWGSARWVPADPDSAFAPVIRAKAALDPAHPPAAQATALAGLAVACGLGPRLLPYGPPGAREELAGRVRLLGPDLRALISQAQAAVDSALLTHRL